ncbi:MAG TPA: ATP-binding cassette domain-containing protein [Mycobacteriales bacterium]|jgi:branched-chain amino acid transport system ATP-binding protein|nr:ATP-binding cassette domain-containing protein [Mycobacteriales bacterium]
MTPPLSVQGVTVAFGELRALHDVSFEVHAASITGLIGPNGAGKTTLLDVISGYLRADRGTVHVDGAAVDGVSAHRRAAMGLGRTFQTMELFDDLSVAENLLVATESAGAGAEAAREAARTVGLSANDRRLAAALSHGERKRLALARALAARPRLLLLDEPAAGLDAADRADLISLLARIVDAGTAVLLVDHDLGLVLETCDRVLVLDFGRLIADGTPSEVRDDPAVVAAYVGSGAEAPSSTTAPRASAPPTPSASSTPALAVTGLTAGYGDAPVVRAVDLYVDSGEVVVLLGPNGAGKTTTLLAVSGAVPHVRGDVRVLGEPLRGGGYRQARRGVAHVLQETRVFAGLTAADNLRLVTADREAVADVLDLLPGLRPVLRRPAGRLSGGEQQLLALARALVTRPRLLVVDELSLGLAPAAVAELLPALSRLAESGTAILLAEQHADLALRIADRAYVLVAGRIVMSDTAAALAADPGRLASAYLGGDEGG